MKIVCASNFDRDNFQEEFINLPVYSEEIGKKLVRAINDLCSGPDSPNYYKLVLDNYVLKGPDV